mgnify:CR=1 FL=1
MKAKLYLDVRPNQLRKKGFPIVVSLNMKGKRKLVTLKHYVFAEDWDFEKEEPINNKRLLFFVRKKKLLLDEIIFNSESGNAIALEEAKNILLDQQPILESVSFYDFFKLFILELENKGKQGNAESYKTALQQLVKFRSKLEFSDINYNLLNDFKNHRFSLSNSKSTIHTYLRKYRAVYYEAARRKLIENTNPFDGVFKGVTVKSNRTKKKHLTKKTIHFLETIHDLPVAQQRALDLFLLQFYFGGQDLIDIYYLEQDKIKNNRVFFMRGKLGGDGYQFDLKITPKAKDILQKYSIPGQYLFPWRKTYEGYKTFRNNMRRSLYFIQDKYNIEVEPLAGKLGSKVARHTFATIGKQLFIETDLLRELMGHERNDVDTIYKDKYPEKTRDAAHLKIID